MCLPLLGIVLSTLAVGTLAAPDADLITSLPGQPLAVPFKQYAGYVPVGATSSKRLFYYFVEAETNPLTKPLVLWLNGGPGCSSLGGGFIELGPFYPNAAGNGLVVNQYSWNKLANIIFLESPAGVGFSYATNTSDYTTGDNQTAQDTLAFLVEWLAKYPEYNGRDFYITGESYAGHYVPQLAAAVLQNNKISGQVQIPLKGVMIGNPVINALTDLDESQFDFAYGHGMISEAAHERLYQTCDYTIPEKSADCIAATITAATEGGGFSPYLNAYDILADVCLTQGKEAKQPREIMHGGTTSPDPCIINEITTYLNRPDVQKALHAEVSNWQPCSSSVNYSLSDQYIQISPILADLVNSGLRVWIYSGDLDIVVPLVGTRKLLTSLAVSKNWNITSEYQIWFEASQIGGWTISWGPMVFSTVRGASHMVPQSQQARALVLFTSFLAGEASPPLAPASPSSAPMSTRLGRDSRFLGAGRFAAPLQKMNERPY